MKKSHLALLVSLALVAAGCTEGTPGGPGVNPRPTTNTSPTTTPSTTVTANRPVIGEAENTFSLNLPVLSTSLKQGETKSVTISLSRGKNFDEDVALQMTGMPQGITIEPAAPMIKHGEQDATIKVHAADDAALGDFTVKVLGHPTQGADATSELKLSVAEK